MEIPTAIRRTAAAASPAIRSGSIVVAKAS
jgi:hypothetical protein